MQPNIMKALGVAAAMIAAVFAFPAVAAHECTAEAGTTGEASCSAPCREGEEHAHTVTHHHENGLGQDESHVHYDCRSKDSGEGGDDEKCTTPKILGVCLIQEGAGAPGVGPPVPCVPGIEIFACNATLSEGRSSEPTVNLRFLP